MKSLFALLFALSFAVPCVAQTVLPPGGSMTVGCAMPPTPVPTPVPTPIPTPVPTPVPTASPSPVPAQHFATLAYGVALPSGMTCAELVRANPIKESVPSNTPFNLPPPGGVPASFYSNPTPLKGDTQSIADFQRVNGQFGGSTDDISRWAACKYGIDEDVVRAQGWVESEWNQGATGDQRTTQSACVQGSFTALWNTTITEPDGSKVSCPNCCYQSWGMWQDKVFYDYTAWPMMMQSTPFAADYRYADQRSCMNGDYATYLNGTSYATDFATYKAGAAPDRMLWGCIGVHFAGRHWYDTSSLNYILQVQDAMQTAPWPGGMQ